MDKKIILAIGLLILFAGGIFAWQYFVAPEKIVPVEKETEMASFIRPSLEVLPQEVRNWVENSLKFDMTRFVNVKEFDGKQYFFVAGGARGFVDNYLVEITDIVVEQEEVVIKAKFTRLSSDQVAPNNPYDLVYIKATGLQARFVHTGDYELLSVSSLAGPHYLPDIVAQSRGIKVFTPSPNEIVGRNFNVSGVANVFEATILYSLSGKEYGSIDSGFTTATQTTPGFTEKSIIRGAMTDWGYFTIDLTVPETMVADEDLILNLYWSSPKDGAITDLIVIPLRFVK